MVARLSKNMAAESSRRIGIFEYDWSMYGFLKDVILKLAEVGYCIDVFYKRPAVGFDFINSDWHQQDSNIRYFEFDDSKSVVQKFIRRITGLLGKLNWNFKQSPNYIINNKILLKSRQIVNESKYQCFIGVEKKGLIWAGILSQLYKCPLIYYSLELYVEDNPEIKTYSYLRKAEQKYHTLSVATIIQDNLRAKALLNFNNIKTTNVIYLPISVKGNIVKKKSNFFHQKYKINLEKKLLLYFGLIRRQRFSTDLVRIAKTLDDDIMLVLHGYGDQAYLTNLQSMADMEHTTFSLDFVGEEEIVDVISSATIGLALYETTNSNDRLAAFSSVKVAYYLKCGVPIIAFDSESFRELMNVYKCGELINSIDEIPQKVEKILADYDSYQAQVFMAFRQFYDFENNFKAFIRNYENLTKN